MENFFKQLRLKQILRLGTASAVLSAAVLPGIAFAATFNPTLLVNTESFLEIDDGDGTTNVQLYFGATEQLLFDVTDARFEFTDDLEVQGNLAVTGNTALTGTLSVTGATTLSTVNTSGLATLNSASVTNNATVGGTLGVTGNTTVGGTLGVTGAVTITGATTVNNTVLATGNISTNNTVVLNADGTADTAALTFGGSSSQTLTYATGRFNFSDDLQVNGFLNVTGTAAVAGATTFGSTVGITGATNIGGTLSVTGATTLSTLNTSGLATLNSASVTNNATVGGTLGVTGNTTVGGTLGVTGALTVTGATALNNGLTVTGNMTGTSLAVTSGTVRINGVTYNVTGTPGGVNTVLVNDGAGNLTWQSNAVANSSGSFMSLHPVFPNVTYKPDGTNNTGQLSQDVISNQNYYIWSTTRGTAQDYDMYVRLQVPENFASWATNGVQVLHNNAGAATVRVDLIDTAGATQAGSATGGVGTINITPSGTYTAGSYMTVKITVSATSAGAARVGYVNLRWITTTP